MDKKINIGFLIVDEHSGQGGLENVLIDITKGLKNLQVHSTILMLYPPKKIEFINNFDDIHIMPQTWVMRKKLDKKLPHFIHYPLWKHAFKRSAKTFLEKHYLPSKIDALVILNLSKNLLRILPIIKDYKKKYPHIPVIAWPHGTISTPSAKVRRALQKNIGIFDHFLAISRGLQQEFEETYHTQNSSLIFNPVAPANKIPRSTSNFVYIGRIGSPDKRVKELLNVLQQLQGNWSLDLIGASDSAANDQSILDHAKYLGIIDKITFYGWQESPWDCVKEASALLLNSQSEGFGLVLVEAMMRGIPCVSSNCPVGPGEIIINNKNGWLYDLNDYNKCQTILQDIIDNTLPTPHSEEIQSTVQHFSTPTVINNFKKAILQVIKEQKN